MAAQLWTIIHSKTDIGGPTCSRDNRRLPVCNVVLFFAVCDSIWCLLTTSGVNKTNNNRHSYRNDQQTHNNGGGKCLLLNIYWSGTQDTYVLYQWANAVSQRGWLIGDLYTWGCRCNIGKNCSTLTSVTKWLWLKVLIELTVINHLLSAICWTCIAKHFASWVKYSYLCHVVVF